jgi:predicted nucleic acid-binding protein
MMLVDTGPLVALFDPQDRQHERCRSALGQMHEALSTTIPVLTEAFHMLSPDSQGSARLRDFVSSGGLSVWFLDQTATARAFELMDKYSDRPMDLADASLIVAAERLKTSRIFTIDRRDFRAYRIRRGHRNCPVEIVP